MRAPSRPPDVVSFSFRSSAGSEETSPFHISCVTALKLQAGDLPGAAACCAPRDLLSGSGPGLAGCCVSLTSLPRPPSRSEDPSGMLPEPG